MIEPFFMFTLKNIQNLRVPFVSILLTALLCLSFTLFKKQDELVWQQLIRQHQEQLLKQELPIYLEFVIRRWEIERQGSAEYIKQLSSLTEANAVDKISRLILSDRYFYPYLVSEAHVFMPPPKLKELLEKRRQISILMSQTSVNRFGLKVEEYRAADFVSYVFVENNELRFTANLVLFILLSLLIEKRYGHTRLLLFVIISSLSTAIAYLLVSAPNAVNLQNSTGVIFGLSIVVVGHLSSPEDKRGVFVAKMVLSVLMIAALVYKTAGEMRSGLVTYSEVIAYLLACVIMYMLFKLNRHIERISLEKELHIAEQNFDEQAVSSNSIENWEFRVALAKALDLISQFDFEKARAALRELRKKYPYSALVLEQQYHLEKLQPDDGEYWQCANDLIQLSVKKHDYARMKRLFNDIQRNAASKKRARVSLKPDNYHKMMMVFVQHDDLTKAEQAFMFLELAGQKDIIKDACTLLIDEFKAREMTVKKQQYQMLYERLI